MIFEWTVRILGVVVGSLGYSIVGGVSPRALVPVAIGDFVSTSIYVAADQLGTSLFLASLTAACFASLFAEIFARIGKMPAVVIMIPSLIPLAPGGALYNAVSCLLKKDYAGALPFAEDAVAVAAGIAGGIICGLALLAVATASARGFCGILAKREKKRKKTDKTQDDRSTLNNG